MLMTNRNQIFRSPLLANRIRMMNRRNRILRARCETRAGAASTKTRSTTAATSRTMNKIDIIVKFS